MLSRQLFIQDKLHFSLCGFELHYRVEKIYRILKLSYFTVFLCMLGGGEYKTVFNAVQGSLLGIIWHIC